MFHQGEYVVQGHVILESQQTIILVVLVTEIADRGTAENGGAVCWQVIVDLNIIEAIFQIVFTIRLKEEMIVLFEQLLIITQFFPMIIAKIRNS
jgi:hypothetical protein